MSVPSSRDVWFSKAARISRRVNLAWWLETLTAPLLIACAAAGAGLLLLRRLFPELSMASLASGAAFLVACILLASWWVARRRFETSKQSLVRIEAWMNLDNALSAADAGIRPWPDAPANTDAGLRWHWPRLVIPPVAALALLAAGLLVPLSGETRATAAPEQPQAWARLESQLDHLKREELIDEAYLDEMQKRLEELRAQKEEQWFSHSSLEATDSLERSHRNELDRLDRELTRAAAALENLEKNSGMNQEQRDKLIQEFDSALQGMQTGGMKPNPKLLEQLKQLDPKDLGKLSPEQLQQLRENFKNFRESMKSDEASGSESDWADELLEGENGEGEGGNTEGNNPQGNGGVEGGPGHSPGVLGQEGRTLETGDLATLEARDLSQALPGDLLQLQDGEHEVDSSASRITEGGGIDSAGRGGDRVWQDRLDPDEQRTLKRFYE